MNISELKPKQGKADITAEVVEKSEPREFNKFGKAGKVCNAKIKDDSGSISLTLWNEQVDQVKVGDKIQIQNGYVNEWQGEMQLSTGKFGTLEVLGSSSNPTVAAVTEDKPKESDTAKELSKSKPSLEESNDDNSEIDIEEESVE
ncbi:MAG: hypothetical protein KKE20_02070 [Nanoarchaeota archaeon]|nr:hypothetical protein [Nanoarchaeota archaeon]